MKHLLNNIITWNVNGIRAVHKKGFIKWVEKSSPDIICLQETKANLDQFPKELLKLEGYSLYSASAQKKGYSGVCAFTKTPPLHVRDSIDIPKFDDEGRTIILEYENLVIINCYFPNGQRDHGRVDYKLEYYDEILKLFHSYNNPDGTDKRKHVIICGDFNTSHKEIDLANPKANKNSTGFLLKEREYIDKYLNHGLVDVFRAKYPEKGQEYTWWTYRNNCRERNIGWRLDYFMCNQAFLSNIKDCEHKQEVLGSDHCPVELTLKDYFV